MKFQSILIFFLFFCSTFAGERDSSYSRKEIVSLGKLNQHSIQLTILRDGVDDVLSYPSLEWKKMNSNNSTNISKKNISEIWGVLNIIDIDNKNYKDSIVVEMTFSRIGVMAYGKMVIHKDKTYTIEIGESNP